MSGSKKSSNFFWTCSNATVLSTALPHRVKNPTHWRGTGLNLPASGISFDLGSFLCHTVAWQASNVAIYGLLASTSWMLEGRRDKGSLTTRPKFVASTRPSHGRTIVVEERPASRLSRAEIQSFRTAEGVSAVESRLVSKAGQEKGARLLWRLLRRP